jgi:peptidoglycan hydrolase-like protein with peptidoglycan-binding domain
VTCQVCRKRAIREFRLRNLRSVVVRIAASVACSAAIATSVAAGTASASTTAPYIREGSRGTGMVCVQKALNDLGARLVADGIDGSKTTAAVKTFQKKVGFQVDGIVGPNTGSYLYSRDQALGIGATCFPVVPTQ